MTHLRWALLVIFLPMAAGCGVPIATTVASVPRSVESVGIKAFSKVKNLVFVKGVPAAPCYHAKSIGTATGILKHLRASSRPYTGTVHGSPHVMTHAYWGPSVLTVTTKNQTIHIYPTSWIVKKGQGFVMHYVPNVLTVKEGAQVHYVINARLYQWFSTGRWQSLFEQE